LVEDWDYGKNFLLQSNTYFAIACGCADDTYSGSDLFEDYYTCIFATADYVEERETVEKIPSYDDIGSSSNDRDALLKCHQRCDSAQEENEMVAYNRFIQTSFHVDCSGISIPEEMDYLDSSDQLENYHDKTCVNHWDTVYKTGSWVYDDDREVYIPTHCREAEDNYFLALEPLDKWDTSYTYSPQYCHWPFSLDFTLATFDDYGKVIDQWCFSRTANNVE